MLISHLIALWVEVWCVLPVSWPCLSLSLFFCPSLSLSLAPFSFLSYRLINLDTFSPKILCFLCSRFPFSGTLSAHLNFPPFSLLCIARSSSTGRSRQRSDMRCLSVPSCRFIFPLLSRLIFSLVSLVHLRYGKSIMKASEERSFSISLALSILTVSQACRRLRHQRHGQALPPAR